MSIGDDVTTVPQPADNIAQRRRWAYAMIRRCSTPPPIYGSAEWRALPDTDVRRVAAVVVAAEAWARDGDELETNLRAEVEALSAAHKREDDAEYVARREQHRAEWKHLRLVRGMAYADSPEFRDGGRAS